MGGGGLLQAQQLPHQSLAKLSPAVPLHVVGIRHLVEDVGIVYGDADGEPEHLLPGLVRFMRDEIPTRTEESERLTLGLLGTRDGAGGMVPKGLITVSAATEPRGGKLAGGWLPSRLSQ